MGEHIYVQVYSIQLHCFEKQNNVWKMRMKMRMKENKTNLDLFWAFLLMVLMQPLSSIPKASNAFLQLTMIALCVFDGSSKRKRKRKKKECEAKAAIRQSLQKRHEEKEKEKKEGKQKENFDFGCFFFTKKRKRHSQQSRSLILLLFFRSNIFSSRRHGVGDVGCTSTFREQFFTERVIACFGCLVDCWLMFLFAKSCVEKKNKTNDWCKEDGRQCNQWCHSSCWWWLCDGAWWMVNIWKKEKNNKQFILQFWAQVRVPSSQKILGTLLLVHVKPNWQ